MENDKNQNYLSWDEAFIALSKLVALRSKNRLHQAGSCIVDGKNRIMSLGYNGLPLGCSDKDFPSVRSESLYDSQESYMIPSAINAILIAKRNLEGCTLYTTDFPSPEETKMIIQNGLDIVYYLSDEFINEADHLASLNMLNASDTYFRRLDDLSIDCTGKSLITWKEVFVGVCKLIAMRSKDTNTDVGSCIVDNQNRIISLGYNGLPFGCDDNDFPWNRDAEKSYNTKYPYVVHAEPNAISIAQSTASKDLSNTKMYVSLFPCHICAAQIIQAGIKKVFYVSDKYNGTDSNRIAKRLFDASGVVYQQVPDIDITVKGYQKTIKR